MAKRRKLISSKNFSTLIVFLILLAFSYIYKKPVTTNVNNNSPTPTVIQTVPQEKTKVTRVVDGDTIIVDGDKRVRYIGMDTPETVDPKKSVACFGKEASDMNKSLVEGKEIIMEKDVSETDKYGRLLRYVWTTDNNGQKDIFINDYLVRQGYAHVATFPPDVRYSSQFTEAQKEARENNRGLWNGCPSK